MTHMPYGGTAVVDRDEGTPDASRVKGVWSDVPLAPEEEREEVSALRALRPPRVPVASFGPPEPAPEPPHPTDLEELEAELEARAAEARAGRDSIESLPPEELLSLPPEPVGPVAAPRPPALPPKRKKKPAPSPLAHLTVPPSPIGVGPSPSEPSPSSEAAVIEPPSPSRGAPTRAASPWGPVGVGFLLGIAAAMVVGYLALQERLGGPSSTALASDQTTAATAPAPEPAPPAASATGSRVTEPALEEAAVTDPTPEPVAIAAPAAGDDAEASAPEQAEERAEETPEEQARRLALEAHAEARRARRAAAVERARATGRSFEEVQAEMEAEAAEAQADVPQLTGPTIGDEPDVAAAAPDLPAHPSREDVAQAIEQIRSELQACAPDARGHVENIRFTFTSSGRVSSALVPNDFAGDGPQRACVARTARRARVPAFGDPRLVVSYPVQF